MRVADWIAKPYSDDMDVTRWVLFVGLIIIIAAGWRGVIKMVEDVA